MLVLSVPPHPNISRSMYTPLLVGDISSILNCITTDSPLHLPLSTSIDITGAFPYISEEVKLSSKFDKQVTIVCLTFQDIQQRCCSLIGNAKHSFCLKTSSIVRST